MFKNILKEALFLYFIYGLKSGRGICMIALRLHKPRSLRIDEVHKPRINSDEILVKVVYSGICGSDLHLYRGALRDRVKYPAILGHELSGVVAEVGERVTWLREGDKVVVNPVLSCGSCVACMAGRYNVCLNFKIMGVDMPGAFAEYVKANGVKAYRVPEGVSLREAALTEPFSVAMHACRRVGIEPGDVVAIIGQGPIGLCVTQVAKHYGAFSIIALDVLDERLETAKKLGADEIINPVKIDPVKVAKRLTSGVGVDKVIEASGSPDALNMAVRMVKPGGRIVVLGLCFREVKIDTSLMVFKEVECIGSRVYLDEFSRTLRLFSKGYLKAEPLITHELPLRDGVRAFKMLDERRGNAIKVLLKP